MPNDNRCFYTDAQIKADLKKELGVKRLSICSKMGNYITILFKAPIGVPIKRDIQKVDFDHAKFMGYFRINKLDSVQTVG